VVNGSLSLTACSSGQVVYKLDVKLSVTPTGGDFAGNISMLNYMTNSYEKLYDYVWSADVFHTVPSYYVSPEGNFSVKIDGYYYSGNRDLRVDVVNVYAYCLNSYDGFALAVGSGGGLYLYRVEGGYAREGLIGIAFPDPQGSLGVNASFALANQLALYVSYSGSALRLRALNLSDPYAEWKDVTNCTVQAAPASLVIEPFVAGGRLGALLAARSSARGSYFCAINDITSAPPSVSYSPLPGGLMVGTAAGYAASASSPEAVYVTGSNQTSGEPLLLAYSPSDSSWRVASRLPTSRVAGLAWGGRALWLMAEGGPLYSWDADTGAWEPYPALLQFTPAGPGDKLEILEARLAFVRGDGTSEVWYLAPS